MIRTAVFRVTRYELMAIAVREYLRIFWWFAIITPVFGIVMMIFGNPIMQVIGAMAFLWPFSLPARSAIASGRSSRLFAPGCHVEADDDEVVFLGEPREGKKPLRYRMPLTDVRGYGIVGDSIVLRTRRLGSIPIKLTAFQSREDVDAFEQLVHDAIDRRLGPPIE